MEGFQAPYVPGFDTHGLPIELKALSSVGDKKKDISKLELRQICEKFATEHIDIMSDQFTGPSLLPTVPPVPRRGRGHPDGWPRNWRVRIHRRTGRCAAA